MAIKTCPNGHRYNTDMNASCPICEQEGNRDFSGWSEMDLSGVTGNGYGPATGYGPGNGFSEMMPTGMANDDYRPSYGGGDNKTVVLNENNAPGGYGPYDPAYDDPTKTRQVGTEGPSRDPMIEYRKQPVVGWLVCIDGPDKGKDYPLHGAKSTIGRQKGSAVELSDKQISRDGFPALIVYDDKKSHKFYLASGDAASHNNVELSGELLLGQKVINPYDEIRIEDSVLVFVPFCGDDFYWQNND